MTKKQRKSKTQGKEVFINIKTDFGFKKIFGNKTLLISFLNALSVLPDKILDIEYLPSEQYGYIKEQRKAAYDVHCRTVNGKHFIIEMQIGKQKYFSNRMLYYSSLAIVNQAPKGKIKRINKKGEETEVAWDYEIAGIYMIAILDFTIFKEKEAKDIVVEHIKLTRQSVNLLFTDKYELITIELPKFKKDLQSLSGIFEQWLYTFINMHKLSEYPKELDSEIIKVFKEAQINNLTQEEMSEYKQSILEYDDVFHAVNWAKEEGIEIGEKRGRKRGIEVGRKLMIEEIVRNNYKLNMSIKQIAEFTGLTEEQISAILK
ncbi:MAG: Rpn family recombination-promoting nuclease/putative transposase, partial [Prevotellaceae bacterium]|nr:Rpn family recombination-promoting nuclease/putative transposase [Prevotellaceae bacterium]